MSRTYKDSKKGKAKLSEQFYWIGPIPSWFKAMKKRIRRAKEKQALRVGKEAPIFKKTDAWDWW